MLTWDDYRRWLGPLLVRPTLPLAAAPSLDRWVSDSRLVKPGQWFVPIKGERFDGHDHIVEAMAKGAGGFFYEANRAAELPADLLSRGLAVTDPLAAFQQVAAGWRLTLRELKLVALTGSAGKTTTKELLAAALKASGPTYATQASFNNEVGVPKTLQQLAPEHRFAAVEFGARMPGNIRFLCELAAPDVVGLLNVGVAHLGIFGSVQALLDTKLEIFRNSPAHAVQVAFADDPRILAGAQKTGKKLLTFGRSEAADVRLLAADWSAEGAGGAPKGGMMVRLSYQGAESAIALGVAHEAFPLNVAAAFAMAIAAGAPRRSVEAGLAGFSGMKGRYQVHRLQELVVIDDTYNANTESMVAGLSTLARAFPTERKVVVLGDMLELGDGSAAEHRKVGSLCATRVKPELLITVGQDARHIGEGAVASGLAPSRLKTFPSVDALLAANLGFASLGEVLYAKGSNGIKLARLVDQLTSPKETAS